MARILIIKFGAIGDVIMAIPAAHALYQQGNEIHWVCGQAVAPLLACYPWIHTIIADDRALLRGSKPEQFKALTTLWRTLAGRRYALCATLYYDKRYEWIALPIRAHRKLMLSKTDRATSLLPGRHHTNEYARILLNLEDRERPLSLAPVRPEILPPSPLERVANKARIVIAPAGARNMVRDDALRRWPAESYVAIARELLNRGLDVVLIGGPDDAWVTPAFAGLAVNNQIGKLTLIETIALLDAGDVLVTHDTGPLHLAGITSTGIVSIFGPTDPRGRIPQRSNVVALWGGEGFACRPCYDGRDFAPCPNNGCMQQVTPAMVLEQIDAVLDQLQDQRRNAPHPPRVLTPPSTLPPEPQ
jgi:heptosyltransferase-2